MTISWTQDISSWTDASTIRCIFEFIQGVPYSSEGRSGVKYKDTFIKGKGASHVVRIMQKLIKCYWPWESKNEKTRKILPIFYHMDYWSKSRDILFVGKSVYNVISWKHFNSWFLNQGNGLKRNRDTSFSHFPFDLSAYSTCVCLNRHKNSRKLHEATYNFFKIMVQL